MPGDVHEWLILVVEISEALFCIVTLPIYVIVLTIIFRGFVQKNPNLCKPFFVCCFIVGIADIGVMVINDIASVAPKACLFRNWFITHEKAVLKLYYIVIWIGGMCQTLSVTVIAINRFCILIRRDILEKLWKPPLVFIFYGIQIVPAVVWGTLTIRFPAIYEARGECQLFAEVLDLEGIRFYMKVGGAGLVLSSIIAMTLYSIMFCNIHRENAKIRKMAKRPLWVKAEREYRLLTVSVIICTTQTIFAFYMVLREVFMFDYNFHYGNLLNDIYAGINPYLLLAFSRHIRQSFPLNLRALARWKKKTRTPQPSRHPSKTGIAAPGGLSFARIAVNGSQM